MKIQAPPVGMPIQFFPGGIRDVNRQPWSGSVVESGADGCVKIVCDVPGGGSVGNNEFHRWMGDTEWIQQNKEFLAKASATMPRGCWDYVPGLELFVRGASRTGKTLPEAKGITAFARQEPSQEVNEAEKQVKLDRLHRGMDMVEELHEKGKEVDDIFKSVRSFGLRKSDVENLVAAAAEKAEVPA